MEGLFDRVMVSHHEEEAVGKARAARELISPLAPESCLWIGDTQVDVRAARSLGCPVAVVTCGLRSESYLKSLVPDFISPGLAQIDLGYCNDHWPVPHN